MATTGDFNLAIDTSRGVFSFHRPETLAKWVRAWRDDPDSATLRQRLVHGLPPLDSKGLWPAQEVAIRNLEGSLQQFHPRALIQMATGSGKTFTAANIAYRLSRWAGARRILFLVDRANLGRQTLKEFQHFETPDDGRKFAELYNVHRLETNTVDPVAKVTITTIQRLYSILKGEPELPEEVEEATGFEIEPTQPVEVSYNPAVPIEFFDVVVVDECHRSIYGVWRQVLDYFDAFTIGLTATPGAQTFAFFNQNLVMEYTHEAAVADDVNVDFDVYRIRTEITEKGSTVDAGLVARFRDRETRAVRMEVLDEDFTFEGTDLDRTVMAPDQIRTIIQTFKDRLPTEIFPGRTEVPKTLIFAKTDAHADDIVQIVRDVFGKGNDFAVKITYRTALGGQKPEDLLASFRNSYNPRIAVTVDMIATGTDVKPLECVVFMRLVKSRNYFEQMKGRGVRVINPHDLRAVTPDAAFKDRFVIVDAVGATETELNETQPMERSRTVPLDRLLQNVAMGTYGPDEVSSVAVRLARLNTRLNRHEREQLEDSAGMPLVELIHALVGATDPDHQLQAAQAATGAEEPTQDDLERTTAVLLAEAVEPIADNPHLRTLLVDIQRTHEQLIDEFSKDTVIEAGYSSDATDRARHTVESWEQFVIDHRDDITALQVLYSQPYGTIRLTFAQLKDLAQAIERPPHGWTPDRLWGAYEALGKATAHGSDQRVLTDLVSLVRQALDPDHDLVPFPDLVDQRYQAWLAEQEAAGRIFTPEQRVWLDRIRDHIAASLRITADDLDSPGFSEHGGLGAAYATLGDDLTDLLDQLNQELAA